MSTRKLSRHKRPGVVRPSRGRVVITIAIALSLFAAWTMLASSGAFDSVLRQKTKKGQDFSAASFNSNSPSKEYVYVGGRLVATEEPVSSSLSAPANLRATTASSSTIQITWNAVSGAVRYQLERSSNYGGANNGFGIVDANIVASTFCSGSIAGVIGYCDMVTSGAAYIYRVLAFDQGGNPSPPSNIDLATATSFFEDPVSHGMSVKEAHLLELRQAINYVRTAAGVGAFNFWTDNPPPMLAQRVAIQKIHIDELRSRLGEARTALSLPSPSYTDPTILQFGTSVQAAHIQELRRLVKGYLTAIDNP